MPHAARIIAVITAAALAALLSVAPASGATRSVKAAKVKDTTVVFKLRGRVKPSSVGSATIRVARYRRKISAKRMRRAARRGRLVVRLPRHVRPVNRKAAPRLIVRTRPSAGNRSRPAWKAPECDIPSGASYVTPSTLEKAEQEARPGTTLVLRGGDYGRLGEQILMRRDGTAGAPIRWVAAPGEAPVLRGQVAVEGSHRRFCGLHFNGPSGNFEPSHDNGDEVKLFIGGDDVEVTGSEITGSRWHAGVYLNGARDFRLAGNYVHDNGRFDDPEHANLDHGIYVGSGSGVIEDNRIVHNVAHAVQLYPDARGVIVRGNEMRRHGRAAVMVAEDAADNEIYENEIYDNHKGIESWQLRGRGNVARDNRLWDNREGNIVGVPDYFETRNNRAS